jgi:hypothetical protein
MKHASVLFLFFLCLCLTVSAQAHRDSLLFRGVIMEGDSLFTLPFAKYIVNNEKDYVSNEDGQFSFWAKNGDIVHFSYVGFKPLYVQIHDTLSNDSFLMGVFLSRDTIELSEVVILPHLINPDAMARTMPLLSTSEQVVAQRNIDVSAYQAMTQPVKEWDAEMNQKNFIQERSNDVAYRTQIQPNQMVGLSTLSVGQEVSRQKLKKRLKERRQYITTDEWSYLISSYQERINEKNAQLLK